MTFGNWNALEILTVEERKIRRLIHDAVSTETLRMADAHQKLEARTPSAVREMNIL